MRRRYKPQRIGLNPEWFKVRIFKPLFKICIIAAVITFGLCQYNAYSEKKAIEHEEQKLIDESIAAEERQKQESIRAKAEAEAEEERRKESIKQIELERQHTNTLYENKISKKVCPIGTYLRNNEIKRVGRVTGYYGLEVTTNNDWNFDIDTNGVMPDYIDVIGYSEYTKSLQRQKIQEEKKNRKENAKKLQQLLDDEINALTKKTKEYFGNKDHFIYNNKKYRLIKIVGDELIVLEKGKRDKKQNYTTLKLTSEIQPISYIEYEINK